MWFILLAAGSAALADEVKLKDGGRIEGLVSEDGVRVYVETGFGDVEVAADQVESINYDHEAPIEEFYRRWDKVRGSSRAEDFCELARWCEANRCTKFVKMLTSRRDRLEPDHSCGATVVRANEKPQAPAAEQPPKKAPPKEATKKPKEKVWVMRETIMVGIHPYSHRLFSGSANTTGLPLPGQTGWLPGLPSAGSGARGQGSPYNGGGR